MTIRIKIIKFTGTGPIRAAPIALNSSGNPDTEPPRVIRRPKPSNTMRVPSVTSIATTPI